MLPKVYKQQKRKGFSTLEILISLFIFSVVTASLITVSFGSQAMVEGSAIFQKTFPEIQKSLKISLASLSSNFNHAIKTDEQVEAEEILIDNFTKKIIIKSLNDSADYEVFSFVTDWENALGGDTCFRKLSEKEYEIKSTLLLTESADASDIDVVRGKAYVTVESSSSPNLLTVDVTDPEDPKIISNKNFSTGKKLNSLHLAGEYALLASNSTVEQIQIVNVMDLDNLEVVHEFELPENENKGESIFYENKNQKLFLGTSHSEEGGPEFHVFDVSNLPNTIHQKSTEVGVKINDIASRENYIFLATPNPSPLRIINTDDPDSVLEISVPEEIGNSPQVHGGQKIAVLNDRLFLGRSIGLPHPGYHELLVFNIYNPAEPELNYSFHLDGGVRDLLLRENFAVLAVLGDEPGIQFWSLKENDELEFAYSLPLPKKPKALDCEEETLYVVTESPSDLIIISPENKNG